MLANDEYWETLPERQPRVVMKYGKKLFPAKYSDQVIDVAYMDDPSLLEKMEWTNHHYACQGGVKDNPQFEELYYKDGFLYFKAEYNEWSREESIGWRDGYLRVRTEYYRLKLGEEQAELLYYY